MGVPNTDGVIAGAAASGGEPNPNPPAGAAAGAGEAPRFAPPKMDTRSSSGLLDVPASRFAAAGVDASTVVAARPDGWPPSGASSEKSSRFSACCPAATVCRAFCVARRSSPGLRGIDSDDQSNASMATFTNVLCSFSLHGVHTNATPTNKRFCRFVVYTGKQRDLAQELLEQTW